MEGSRAINPVAIEDIGKYLPGRGSAQGGRTRAPSRGLFRYIVAATGIHQVALSVLTVIVFLLELVPLELQRRIVNDIAGRSAFRAILVLGIAYAVLVLCQGSIKLGLNVYRGWVGEYATRDLRQQIYRQVTTTPDASPQTSDARGVQISMVIAEVEPIGGFVGASVSEPLLQGGILLTVLAYMVHLEPWMALASFLAFSPQLVFVPMMQHAINRRVGMRVRTLRTVGMDIINPLRRGHRDKAAWTKRINHVFVLDMGIFRLKFSMNFLMNLCYQLEILAVLLLGAWFVLDGRIELGAVVAMISAVNRLNDPWGDLVNYFRDLSATEVKFRLVGDALDTLVAEDQPGEAAASPVA